MFDLFTCTVMINYVLLKSGYLLFANNERINTTEIFGTYIDHYFNRPSNRPGLYTHGLAVRLLGYAVWACKYPGMWTRQCLVFKQPVHSCVRLTVSVRP